MDPYQAALERCKIDPGLPVANPTKSFWQKTPHATLENIRSSVLPQIADIVVIGSGITGCSFVHHLLAERPDTNIVMLEARTITSGATGRNGGHIKDSPFHEYAHLKERLGKPAAQKIVRFKMSHLNTIIRVAEESGAEAVQRSELRQVHGIHAFTDPYIWKLSKAELLAFLEDFPDQKGRWKTFEGEELEELRLENVSGAITGPAGALSPYQLVTTLLERLFQHNSTSFHIETNTPVDSIAADTSGGYEVHTSRGTIKTATIIHCTNGYAGHLLPRLRGAINPVRGQMTVQAPGQNFRNEGSNQSWSFVHQRGFDYMTQSGRTGDIFLGGGLLKGDNKGLDDFGNSDDSQESHLSITHLGGLLPIVFGPRNWGPGSNDSLRVKRTWTGIMGWSADGLPWVGNIPSSIAGRDGSGEWLAAGYTGEGMVTAWRCGEALVNMILGKDDSSWFPEEFLLTEERLGSVDPQAGLEIWL